MTTKVDYRPALESYVKKYFDEYLKYTQGVNASGAAYNHVIQIGISVLETKYPEIGPGYAGGGFVQAVVNNDLMEAMGRADDVNVRFLKFYCKLIFNFNPYQLDEYKKNMV